jgi:hypothetical protein
VLAGGNLYLLARNGTTTVVRPGRKFEVISTNALEEITTASPAVSNGRIYIRTYDSLWAIGK